MDVLISGSAGPAQGGWTVRPNRPVSLSGGPLGSEGRGPALDSGPVSVGEEQGGLTSKQCLEWSRGATNPRVEVQQSVQGPPILSTLEVEREGPSPLSQANRVVRPGPGSCRQQLCSDLSSYCSTQKVLGMYVLYFVPPGRSLDKYTAEAVHYMAIT